jgi:hypothetical protein
MDFGTSWLDKLWEAQAEGAARKDPWKLRLERMRGKIDYDGLERVTTQMLFDVLEVPQRSRTAGACRRLAAVMAELGWTAVRVRGLTPGGYREQVRGYCRDARNQQLIEIAGALPEFTPSSTIPHFQHMARATRSAPFSAYLSHRRLGFLARDIFTVLSIYRKKG